MNRAERRRQEREGRKKSEQKRQQTPTLRLAVATLKKQLQQAQSPQAVQQLVHTLVEQGLPAEAGEELSVYAAEFHDATALLKAGKDAERVETLVANAHGWAETMIEQSPEKERRACRAGCAFCCYLPTVLVTAAEAVYLAEWLRTHCSAEELKALRQRLVDRQQSAHVPAPSLPNKPLPCALLRDNQCMAYVARPLKCRGWNSMRREACEQAYGHGQSSPPILFDTYAFIMSNAILNGLSDSTENVGLDGATYDLTSALLQALEIPDAVQRWRNGERLFTVPSVSSRSIMNQDVHSLDT